ncbi:unnamed protein product (macronuclear) [Paramecium tetraurelia]|uniref:WD40-repeat-containing domain n=1 Tax=Paramecium tetraurelia TaxID=5888 RepID=A0DBW5_PARTE|nr:uncharacterized protein GSPATT00015409001 [Paramecium tetraurelia]CAK80532.1 unnamed protein product [Paramecium tetraurelia]|eukprot:XP_001447929.1 hypothetical protein (macronuclear) [Paramecium tetraurelia strain d4-2]
MSSQINTQALVPQILCQKESCKDKRENIKTIFSCNLQKNLNNDSITNCKGCIGKKCDPSVNPCQINLDDLCLQLRKQKIHEKEILQIFEVLKKKLEQTIQNAHNEIEKLKSKILEIDQAIVEMCLFKNNSKLEEFINRGKQAPLDLLIDMVKELREKIFIVEKVDQNIQQQIQYNQDKLNVIYEDGTIRINDVLKNKLQQMSQMISCFKKQVSQINNNNYNFSLEKNQNITSNYQKIEGPDNLSVKTIYNLRFNRSNNLFAIGTSNLNSEKVSCVEIWKIDNNKIELVQSLQQYPDVTALCFGKKDDSLITGSLDSKIILWSPQPKQKDPYQESNSQPKITPKGYINCIEINQNSRILAIGSEELIIFEQNNSNWVKIAQLEEQVKNIAFSNCNKIIVVQCIKNREERIELYYIQESQNQTIQIIAFRDLNQAQQNQTISSTRFMFLNILNKVKIYKLNNNTAQREDIDSIEKLNFTQKSGIGFCSNSSSTSLLAFSQSVNDNGVTQILKINEKNEVTFLQSIQQKGQKLFFSNGGQILVIWDGNNLVVFKDKSNPRSQ